MSFERAKRIRECITKLKSIEKLLNTVASDLRSAYCDEVDLFVDATLDSRATQTAIERIDGLDDVIRDIRNINIADIVDYLESIIE